MPYVSNAPLKRFSLELLCSVCNNFLPTLKNGFFPNKKKELDQETKDYITVDLKTSCRDHPDAPFFPIFKTELRGEQLEEAYQ